MTYLSLGERIRRTRLLAPSLPGTMAGRPDSARLRASSRLSRRKPAWRCLASGPWHLKQLLDRMGRMSRLYSTVCSLAAAARPVGISQQTAASETSDRDIRDKRTVWREEI